MELLNMSSQVLSIRRAVHDFEARYSGLPGDVRDAAKALKGCTDCDPAAASAGDGVIGRADFFNSLLPQVRGRIRLPAATPEDETVLFWSHLRQAGLLGGKTAAQLQDGMEADWGSVYPAATIGGSGFIAGYSGGTPLPLSLSPATVTPKKGIVIVLVSTAVLQGEAAMNEAGRQALSPAMAAISDRHMDDGKPASGYVQAYGAPECFTTGEPYRGAAKTDKYFYNETNTGKDCGLIFWMGEK